MGRLSGFIDGHMTSILLGSRHETATLFELELGQELLHSQVLVFLQLASLHKEMVWGFTDRLLEIYHLGDFRLRKTAII